MAPGLNVVVASHAGGQGASDDSDAERTQNRRMEIVQR